MFGALNVATGKVIGQLKRHHRSTELLQSLNAIDTAVPADEDIHLMMDIYRTQKIEKVRIWFAVRPYYHVYFTPSPAP